MKNQKKIRDYGIVVGDLDTGKLNSITDVDGVLVGHITVDTNDNKTGVTAVLPHGDNIFKEKVLAASHVINGFGKSIGTIQINELGSIETPIILTNTLSVGTACDSLIKYMLDNNEDIGDTTGTINSVVCECNDGYLNNIRKNILTKEHVYEAIKCADKEFLEGSVGAGTGMSCYKLKGGIGTSSRTFKIDKEDYVLGALVLTNMGSIRDFILDGKNAGKIICDIEERKSLIDNEEDKGSIIILVATDLPLSERQLNRVLKRVTVGLGKTGSQIGNGSGDIVIGFTTANKIKHYEDNDIINLKTIKEDNINIAFKAVIESTEEAIYNSMITAETTVGRKGNIRKSLREYINSII